MPIEIHKGTPQYTTDAMRARVQGSIVVECVVQTNGACTNIRVTRSFDPAFGLDQEAIKAAAQWQFRPGTSAAEGVVSDAQGNVYGAEVGPKAVKKYVKK